MVCLMHRAWINLADKRLPWKRNERAVPWHGIDWPRGREVDVRSFAADAAPIGSLIRMVDGEGVADLPAPKGKLVIARKPILIARFTHHGNRHTSEFLALSNGDGPQVSAQAEINTWSVLGFPSCCERRCGAERIAAHLVDLLVRVHGGQQLQPPDGVQWGEDEFWWSYGNNDAEVAGFSQAWGAAAFWCLLFFETGRIKLTPAGLNWLLADHRARGIELNADAERMRLNQTFVDASGAGFVSTGPISASEGGIVNLGDISAGPGAAIGAGATGAFQSQGVGMNVAWSQADADVLRQVCDIVVQHQALVPPERLSDVVEAYNHLRQSVDANVPTPQAKKGGSILLGVMNQTIEKVGGPLLVAALNNILNR
jgi:hypothetical protein